MPQAPEIEVALVQINNSFSGQNYLPLAIGYLQSYLEEYSVNPGRYNFLDPIFKREPIGEIVDKLKGADVAGFSLYVWNANISLEIARRLREVNPDMLIMFGGPQVPDYADEFLRQYPFIDLAVHGEGEKTFLSIMETLPSRDFSETGGVSYIQEDGTYHHTGRVNRIRDLMEVPSPFKNGYFDSLIEKNPEQKWIALWESNRGCPFQCTYCDWGSATAAKVTKFEMDRLETELDWISNNDIGYVFVCDANFGMLKRDVDLSQRVADNRRRTGYPEGFSVQNTKNATERAYLTQKILAESGLNKGVALSMQTLNQEALVNIKRDNISLETYLELQRRFTKDGVETYSDLILALPGETYESYVHGIDTLMETGQHNRIQFNNLSILPNAEMAAPHYIEMHGMKTIESEIINIHGSREALEDDVAETQILVVATKTMPEDDWRKTRAISWMTALLHYDKLFQIPIILAHELSGVPYRTILEAFMEVDREKYPTLGRVRDFFIEEARLIQNGGSEYVYSEEYLGIYWPADEFMFIKLAVDQALGEFYDEAGDMLTDILADHGYEMPQGCLEDAVNLNRALVKLPFASGKVTVETKYDILGFYHAARGGKPQPLEKRAVMVEIDRDQARYDDLNDWCREVVWWGNKKGAYLYTNNVVEKALAGHF